MRLPEPVANWYAGLGRRERRLVVLCAAFVAALIVYLAAIQPLVSVHQSLAREVHSDRALLAYLYHAATRLDAAGPVSRHGRLTGSVFGAVSSAARESAIGNSVQRLEQAGSGGVRLTLAAVSFDALVRWLEALADDKAIVVETANIQGAQVPGTVNATLTLNVHR